MCVFSHWQTWKRERTQAPGRVEADLLRWRQLLLYLFCTPTGILNKQVQVKIIIWNLLTFLETIRKVTFIYTIFFFYVIQSHLCLYSQAYADGSQYMASHDNLSPPYSNSRLAGKRPHSLCLCVSLSLSLVFKCWPSGLIVLSETMIGHFLHVQLWCVCFIDSTVSVSLRRFLSVSNWKFQIQLTQE